MSSAIGIVAAVIGLVAVLAAGLLLIVVRRSPSRAAPATPAAPADVRGAPATPELAAGELRGETGAGAELAQWRLEEAGRAADQVRAAAESDAAGIVRRAEEAAERIAKACTEAEADLRSAKDEASQLRADLERREIRLAERERRLDSELQALEQRSGTLDQARQELELERG